MVCSAGLFRDLGLDVAAAARAPRWKPPSRRRRASALTDPPCAGRRRRAAHDLGGALGQPLVGDRCFPSAGCGSGLWARHGVAGRGRVGRCRPPRPSGAASARRAAGPAGRRIGAGVGRAGSTGRQPSGGRGRWPAGAVLRGAPDLPLRRAAGRAPRADGSVGRGSCGPRWLGGRRCRRPWRRPGGVDRASAASRGSAAGSGRRCSAAPTARPLAGPCLGRVRRARASTAVAPATPAPAGRWSWPRRPIRAGCSAGATGRGGRGGAARRRAVGSSAFGSTTTAATPPCFCSRSWTRTPCRAGEPRPPRTARGPRRPGPSGVCVRLRVRQPGVELGEPLRRSSRCPRPGRRASPRRSPAASRTARPGRPAARTRWRSPGVRRPDG